MHCVTKTSMAQHIIDRYISNPRSVSPVSVDRHGVSSVLTIPWAWEADLRSMAETYGSNEAFHLAWFVAARIKDRLRRIAKFPNADPAADLVRDTKSDVFLRLGSTNWKVPLPTGTWIDLLEGLADNLPLFSSSVEGGMATALTCVFVFDKASVPGGPTDKQRYTMRKIMTEIGAVPSVADRLSFRSASSFIGKYYDELMEGRMSGRSSVYRADDEERASR